MATIPSLKVCNRIFHVPKKRAFFLSSGRNFKCKGSMAIEGSLVLPIFLLFMMTVLLSLEAVRLQSNVAEGLYLTGNRYAVSVHNEGNPELRAIDVEARMKAYLDEQFLPYLCVKGGRDGMQVQDISSLHSGRVEILAEYHLASVIWWLPVGEILIEDRFLGHTWTGYTGGEVWESGREKEIYVYITKTGSKYHLSDTCSYLKVQVKAVDVKWLEDGRNKWGAKYYPCSKCKPGESGTVYVSEDGRNYHSYGDCSALKRTIYIIPMSEAEDYSACSKCGK